MRVYKYYPAKWAWEAIIKKRLKVSTYSDINDPFEFRAIGSEDRVVRQMIEGMLKQLQGKIGFVSFCKNRKNPVIWSHYAESYKGICLGFDVDDQLLNKIDYVRKRINLSEEAYWEVTEDRDRFPKLLLTTKFSHWKYESKRKVFFKLNEQEVIHENGLFFAPFTDNFSLKEVILGPKYVMPADEFKRRELAIALEGLSDCKIKTARLAFKSFNVVLQRKKVFKEDCSEVNLL